MPHQRACTFTLPQVADNKEISGGALPKDLASAKHRMESSRRPLGRGVLWFDALLATANEAYRLVDKKTNVGQACRQFLSFASDEALLKWLCSPTRRTSTWSC